MRTSSKSPNHNNFVFLLLAMLVIAAHEIYERRQEKRAIRHLNARLAGE